MLNPSIKKNYQINEMEELSRLRWKQKSTYA